jgi:hypothetical protein
MHFQDGERDSIFSICSCEFIVICSPDEVCSVYSATVMYTAVWSAAFYVRTLFQLNDWVSI